MKLSIVALVLVVASTLAPAGTLAAVGAPEAALQSTPGVLYTVNTTAGTFVIVKNNGTAATFRIGGATRISRSGRTVPLGQLVLNDRVVVRHAVGSNLAVRVTAAGPQIKRFEGPIVDVAKGAGRVFVTVAGRRVTFFTSASSRFSRRAQRGSLSQLERGDVLALAVQMRHRPGSTRLVPVVVAGLDDGVETAEVKGTIKDIVGHAVTITPKNGTADVTVTVDDTLTIIEVDGRRAVLTDLAVGDSVESHYQPTTHVALSIETDDDGEADDSEVIGTVAGKTSTSVTIMPTGGGSDITVGVGPSTEIEVNGFEGAVLADIKVGMPVRAEYDSSSFMASEIEAGTDHGGDDDGRAEVRGIITAVVVDGANPGITVNVNGTPLVLKVGPGTAIRVDDHMATLADLRAGWGVEVKYDVATLTAIKIHADDHRRSR